MLASNYYTLLKIKASRAIRGVGRDVKKRLGRGNAGTPSSLFGGTILPPEKDNREKKYKSTLAVAVAGTAIGVSHIAAVSGKYRSVVSGKSTLCIGVLSGLVTAGVWYNYVDAAYDGITEDDISMMFEMANSTGYGNLDNDDDSAKAVDILHAIVTGKVDEGKGKSESMFKYEDEDDDDDDDDDDENVFSKKVSFSTPDSNTSTFGNRGIGKSLFKSSSSTIRKSYLPELDKQEAEGDDTDAAEDWMDFK